MVFKHFLLFIVGGYNHDPFFLIVLSSSAQGFHSCGGDHIRRVSEVREREGGEGEGFAAKRGQGIRCEGRGCPSLPF